MELQLRPPLIVLDDVALFLDIDGTLIDIAPRPNDVVVPKALPTTLESLQKKTAGALALVSGRTLASIDDLFAPLQLAAVGGHGAEIRARPGGRIDYSRAQPLDPRLVRELVAFAFKRPGVLIEDKGYSVAVHYRLVPEQETAIRDGIEAICAEWPGTVTLLLGKEVVEVKQPHIDKGMGLKELMKKPPFAGRAPVFVGDDVTDEAAIAAIGDFDGIGFSVGREIPGAAYQFKSPADVRRWLGSLDSESERPD